MEEYMIINKKKKRKEKRVHDKNACQEQDLTQVRVRFGLVWFLCLMAYQLFLGYLMPKPFS